MNTISKSTAALMIAPRATTSHPCAPSRFSGRRPLYAPAAPGGRKRQSHPPAGLVRRQRSAAVHEHRRHRLRLSVPVRLDRPGRSAPAGHTAFSTNAQMARPRVAAMPLQHFSERSSACRPRSRTRTPLPSTVNSCSNGRVIVRQFQMTDGVAVAVGNVIREADGALRPIRLKATGKVAEKFEKLVSSRVVGGAFGRGPCSTRESRSWSTGPYRGKTRRLPSTTPPPTCT